MVERGGEDSGLSGQRAAIGEELACSCVTTWASSSQGRAWDPGGVGGQWQGAVPLSPVMK